MQKPNTQQQSLSQNLKALDSLKKADLQAKYQEVFGEAPAADATMEVMKDALRDALITVFNHSALSAASGEAVDSKKVEELQTALNAQIKRNEELEALAEQQKATAGKNIPDENALKAKPAKAVRARFFGNKDEKKEHPLPGDWQDMVVVKQCQISDMNGGMVEVPNTHQIQTYDPAMFEKLSADSKGSPSFFSESKMKVVVLHDPRQ